MSMWTTLAARLRSLMGREPDRDLGDELHFHLEMEAANLERQGVAPDVARREARRRLGGYDRYNEEMRDVRGGRWRDALIQDARYGLRMWRRFPAFTAIVLATLAIAIGANTAIFSVVDAALLRPLPFPNDDRLAMLYAQNPDRSFPRFSISYADFLDWRKDTRSFAGMAAFTTSSLTLLTDGDPVRLSGMSVTSDYFDVLGARAKLGRVYHANDGERETSGEVVLTYAFWTRQFSGDSTIVGRALKIGGQTRTVVGVLPQSFDMFSPGTDAVIVLDPTSIPDYQDHSQHMLVGIARLKPGVSQAAAQQDLAAEAARLATTYPLIAGWSANVFMMRDEAARTLKQPLLVLFAAAGLVLLIGCINVANLLVTRSALRDREVALRQAIGASRGRLVSQLVVESAELAIGGAVLGLGVAALLLKLIVAVSPANLLPPDIALDLRVMSFALVIGFVTTMLVGLWPAFSATGGRFGRALQEGGRSPTGGRGALRARRTLVVAETSLALVLLVCAALVVQSLRHLLDVNPGFSPEHVVTMRVSLNGRRYNDTTQVAFFRDLQARLEGRGGIEAVAAGNTPPIAGGGIVTNTRIVDAARPSIQPVMNAVTAVTPGYFRTMGMRLLQGRDVSWSDARATIVVSRSAAAKYWPDQPAVGKRIAFGQRDTIGVEVVGVVNDAHARGMTTDSPPMIYLHYAGATSLGRTMSLVVRGRGDVAAVLATTKQAVHEIDATLPLYSPMPVADLIGQSVAQPRLNTTLLSLFAVIALVLAAIGIYGVVSYSVARRTQEIGVRMALGAGQGDVLRLVLMEGAMLAIVGAIIGLAASAFATPIIRSWLFGIEPSDPATLVATVIGIVALALAASGLPARRATRVDPLVAMRSD